MADSQKTYFVVSDPHGFTSELKESLASAHFNLQDPSHILIICGDIFDRGQEAVEMYEFIISIPKSRRILIKGNHESLYLSLLRRKTPGSHDFSNGTVDTFCQIAGIPIITTDTGHTIRTSEYLRSRLHFNYIERHECLAFDDNDSDTPKLWRRIFSAVASHPITKFLKRKEWRDFYELDKFIFVHSFLPTRLKKLYEEKYGLYSYLLSDPQCFEVIPEWRSASHNEWESARWGNPWSQFHHGLFANEIRSGKTLVCGHWHTSDFFYNLTSLPTPPAPSPIFFSEHLIGLDGGVAIDPIYHNLIHSQNVLVIKSAPSTTLPLIQTYTCYDHTLTPLSPVSIVPKITTEPSS